MVFYDGSSFTFFTVTILISTLYCAHKTAFFPLVEQENIQTDKLNMKYFNCFMNLVVFFRQLL